MCHKLGLKKCGASKNQRQKVHVENYKNYKNSILTTYYDEVAKYTPTDAIRVTKFRHLIKLQQFCCEALF